MKSFENKDSSQSDVSFQKNNNEETFSSSSFIEITPLDQEIDNATQKDLSSVPLSEIDFPKNCLYDN